MVEKLLCLIFVIKLSETQLINSRGDTQDIFSSTFQMQTLLKAEIEFAKVLSQHKFEEEDKLVQDFIKTYYDNKWFENITNYEKYVSHPINSFGIVSRTAQAKGYLENQFQNYTNIFPPVENFINVCSAIALIQESFDLKTKDLLNGDIIVENQNFPSDFKPNFFEVTSIATVACNNKWLDTGIEWFEYAFKNVPEDVDPKYLKEARKNYQLAINIHDDLLEKRGPISKKHRCFPVPVDKELAKKKKYKKLVKKSKKAKVSKIKQYFPLFDEKLDTDKDWKDNNLFVCKEGEKWRPPEMDKNLKCYFLNHGDAYLKLGPFKVEEKSQDPFVMIFKDFMSPNEILHYKSQAENNLSRSIYGGDKKGGIFRTSKQTWLHDKTFSIPSNYKEEEEEEHMQGGFLLANDLSQIPKLPTNLADYRHPLDRVAYNLTKRISHGTQLQLLSIFSSESYQIANYGIGGQYGTHFDPSGFLDQTYKKRPEHKGVYYQAVGDRIATFMIYLSDVEAGGATSFPKMGLRSAAKKGDALFWFNLKSTGKVHSLTSHAGCPVLVGSKWITNKWILYYDQFEKFKCSTDIKKDTFEAYSKYRQQNLSLIKSNFK